MEFLTALCYIVRDAVAVAGIVMIMHYIFLARFDFTKIKLTVFSLAVILNGFLGVYGLLRLDPTLTDAMDFISNVIYILAARILTGEKKWTKCIWIVMIFVMTVDMSYSLIVPYVPQGLLSKCLENIAVYSLVCVLIGFFAVKSTVNILPKVFDEIPRWVFVAVMLFELTCYYKEFGISSDWYNAFYLISSVAVILCVAYLFYKLFRLSYEQSAIVRQLEMQMQYSEKAIYGDNELRSFRHDYKNHMIVVKSYLENGKTDEAQKYLDRINNSAGSSMYRISTGNLVADAILNAKAEEAQRENISFTFRGAVPKDDIAGEDICTIISNLLDNAIEACRKIETEKWIEAEGIVKNGNYIFSVTNVCAVAPKKHNSSIRTSKSDSKNHGFGLKNVKAVAEKYNGALTTGCENNIFCADVRLKLKTDKIKV